MKMLKLQLLGAIETILIIPIYHRGNPCHKSLISKNNWDRRYLMTLTGWLTFNQQHLLLSVLQAFGNRYRVKIQRNTIW
jgi:hypothetical protein